MTLSCPNCKKDLVPKMVGDIEIDFCENGCKGIWFDEGEMRKIREVPEKDSLYKDLEGSFIPKPKEDSLQEDKRSCPRCNVELYKYNWDMKSNIFLDACEQCNGIWVDAGELMGMNNYLVSIVEKPALDEDSIQQKLMEIQFATSAKLDKDRNENIEKIVDWDIWIFDDIIRFLMKKFNND